jgi:hypothetical protein
MNEITDNPGCMAPDGADPCPHYTRVLNERNELRRSFDIQWDCALRAIKLWQAANPGKGQIAFSCDRCPETYEPELLGVGSVQREWVDVWQDAKAAGWRARTNPAGQWEHICPNCLSKPIKTLVNGPTIRPLTDYTRRVLKEIAVKPKKIEQVSPGVASRLLHDKLVQASGNLLEITVAGRAMLTKTNWRRRW